MEIVLEQCVLREWRLRDEAALTRHANNKNVSRYLSDIFPYPYTVADASAWLGRHVGVDPPRQLAIVIDGEPVGGVGVAIGKDIQRRSAELGYWLGEEYWGRGIVTACVRAMTAYAFATFDLAHIIAGIFEPNIGSRRVLEKAGFELEGRLRMHVTKDGVTSDDLVFGLVRPDL